MLDLSGDRKAWVRGILKQAFRRTLGALPASAAAPAHYFVHHRRLPDLAHPTRFTEKVIRRKLFDRDPRLPIMADKIAVKEFVANAIGAHYVTPTLWCGESLPPRRERNWPIPYVLKANNGSGTNVFVRRAEDVDWETIKSRCRTWLAASHARWAAEWAYAEIAPRLMVEPYIGDPSRLPLDYKLFVFDGAVRCVEVDTDRAFDHKRTFFDRDWRRQPFSLGYPFDPRPIARPASLEAMIAAAERLGAGFSFVRIDFYDIDGAPRFGEMTFYPDAGIARFSPDLYDMKFGALWR
jgi:hypothetical protein